MQNADQPHPQGDHDLTLDEVLAQAVRDALITRQQSEQLRFIVRQAERAPDHPLIPLAEQGWLSASAPHPPLDIERLTRWLAETTGLEYVRIDPLKIDVAAVTAVIKHAYATRFGILPIAVGGTRSRWRRPSPTCASGSTSSPRC